MHELSTSRSALIRAAVERFLRSRQREELERQIAESFSANAESDRQLMDDSKHVDVEGDLLNKYSQVTIVAPITGAENARPGPTLVRISQGEAGLSKDASKCAMQVVYLTSIL